MSGNPNRSDRSKGQYFIRKFGRNEDIDTGTSEDVWDFGGLYPFPTAAAATTIVSDNAADTGAGTGMQQARVFGLDSNFLEIQEDVTLNGLTPVALSNQYLRVFRIFGLVWGSSGLNQGNVDVLHSPTVLARVTVNRGQTLMAVYTTPADWPTVIVKDLFITIGKQAAVFGEVIFFIRDFGTGGWRGGTTIDLHSQGSSFTPFRFFGDIEIAPKTDIRLTVQSVSANNTAISGGFTLSDR